MVYLAIMSLFHVVVLAVVQGFTEFLPVSSSAHLALAPWLLGWQDQGLTFDIALHFGTLGAVLIYFSRDWLQLLAMGFSVRYTPNDELARNPRLMWLLALATVPVGVIGVLFEKQVETTLRNPVVIGSMLIVVGLLMAVADRIGSRTKQIGAVSFADAMIVGTAQALAIVPGTSRSGITITTALFRGIDREAAARFSFLLSTPAIGGAALLAFLDLREQGGVEPEMVTAFITGIVASALTGCVVIGFFLRFLRRHSLKFFVYYRVIFGIIVIALATVFRSANG
jgi:undecaprenyl-diphosphatase